MFFNELKKYNNLFKRCLFPLKIKIKGTVSVNSSESLCKDGNARFTAIKYELDINDYNFENCLF